MSIELFIKDNDVEISNNRVSKDFLPEIEKAIGVKMGQEIKMYILQYGHLAFDYIEFYDVNAQKALNSELIKQTLFLHVNYPCTKPFIAIENTGDGDYILIDGNDSVYEFIPSMNNEIRALNLKLFDYIVDRFENC